MSSECKNHLIGQNKLGIKPTNQIMSSENEHGKSLIITDSGSNYLKSASSKTGN